MMNRRDFAKTAAALGCALGHAVPVAGAAAGMYISMNGSLTCKLGRYCLES